MSDDEADGDASDAKRGRPFTPGNPFAFKPGQSGNPAGRKPTPKIDIDIKRVLGAQMLEACGLTKSPFRPEMTNLEAWLLALRLNGMKGNGTAIREVHERLFGRVPIPYRIAPGFGGEDDEAMGEFRLIVVGGISGGDAKEAKALEVKGALLAAKDEKLPT